MGNLKLTSSAFSDGGEIPRECGYKNGNKVPPLTVSGIPEGTKSLALIMDDPDAMGAVGKVWVHWVVWHIIPEENDYASGTRHDEIENLFSSTDRLAPSSEVYDRMDQLMKEPYGTILGMTRESRNEVLDEILNYYEHHAHIPKPKSLKVLRSILN